MLLGPVGPSAHEVAAEVRQRGFWAGRSIGDEACAGCHADIAAQWSGSAHRFSSFNNPYYQVATEAFRRDRGPEASRFCGGCHEPVLVASEALGDAFDPASPPAQAGITCAACHMIEAADLEGNGRYRAHVAPFAVEQPFHRARLRAPLLAEARFCGACHKVGLTAEVTRADGKRWQRGQNDYDAWHGSAISGRGAASVFRPGQTQRCQDCHMPAEPASANEQGARDGMVRSHRFIGANAALPHLRGDSDVLARVRRFLTGSASIDLVWTDAKTVDAVLRARGVGHRFPGGTMDSNQVWIDLVAFDAGGRILGQSGRLDAAGQLPPDAHVLRAQPVDQGGEPLRRRDVQHLRGVVFDTALSPSDPQVVRFALPPGTARIEARLLFRKFSPDYAIAACAVVADLVTRRRCEDIPIIEIATATARASDQGAVIGDWRRLVDLGLGLADAPADRAEAARAPLQAARALAPDRLEPLLGLARLALRLGQTDDVKSFAEQAIRVVPEHPAALYVAAQALLRAYRFADARGFAERLARRLPDDRQALTLLARTRGLDRDAPGALAAAEAALRVDPESEDAHLQASLALFDLGRISQAALAQAQFLRYRVASENDLDLRRRWRGLHPQAADEPEPVHTHELHQTAAPR